MEEYTLEQAQALFKDFVVPDYKETNAYLRKVSNDTITNLLEELNKRLTSDDE